MSLETASQVGILPEAEIAEERYPISPDNITRVVGRVNRADVTIGSTCTFFDEQGRPDTSITVYNGMDKQYPEGSVMAMKYTYRSGGAYILRPVSLSLGDNVHGAIVAEGDSAVLVLRKV